MAEEHKKEQMPDTEELKKHLNLHFSKLFQLLLQQVLRQLIIMNGI